MLFTSIHSHFTILFSFNEKNRLMTHALNDSLFHLASDDDITEGAVWRLRKFTVLQPDPAYYYVTVL